MTLTAAKGVATEPFSGSDALTWSNNLTFTGTVTCNSDFTVKGNFYFGDASTDSLTVTGSFAQTYAGTSDGHLITGDGDLTAGKDLARFSTTGSISSTSNVVAIEQATGAGTAGAYGLYINCTGTNVEALKVDAGKAVFDELVTATGGILIDGATTTGINISGASTNELTLQNGESINNVTDGYITTDGALRCSGVGGAGAASALTFAYAETAAAAATATMTNAPAAGNPSVWLSVWYGTTKYVVPLFASA